MSNTDTFKRSEWPVVPEELYEGFGILTPEVEATIRAELAKVPPRVYGQEKQDIKAAFFHCQVAVPIVFRDEPNNEWILVVQHTNTGLGLNCDPIDLVENADGVMVFYGDKLEPHGTSVLRIKDPKNIANKAIGVWILQVFLQKIGVKGKSAAIETWYDFPTITRIVYGDMRDVKKYLQENLEDEEHEYDSNVHGNKRARYEATCCISGLEKLLDLMTDI